MNRRAFTRRLIAFGIGFAFVTIGLSLGWVVAILVSLALLALLVILRSVCGVLAEALEALVDVLEAREDRIEDSDESAERPVVERGAAPPDCTLTHAERVRFDEIVQGIREV